MKTGIDQRACFAVLVGLAATVALPAASAQTFTVLAGGLENPMVGVVHGGIVYGTQTYGGSAGAGLVFRLAGGQFTVVHNFNGGSDGANPNGGLDIDAKGNLFGTATAAGTPGGGTIFEVSTGGTLTVIHNFGGTGDGTYPRQGLVRAGGDTLFGATSGGTVTGDGNVFQQTSTGTYTQLHDFQSLSDGHCPFSGVARDQHGNLYGTTVGLGYGGHPTGSVWKMTPKGVLTTIYVFTNTTDGEWPDLPPVLDKAGNIYGVTHVQNGAGFAGAVWKIDTTGTFSVLHALNGGSDGSGPNAPLVLGGDGNLYGTTASGALGNGTLFQVTPTGGFTIMHSFTGGSDGGQPTGALAVSGRTIYGGAAGTIFKFVP